MYEVVVSTTLSTRERFLAVAAMWQFHESASTRTRSCTLTHFGSLLACYSWAGMRLFAMFMLRFVRTFAFFLSLPSCLLTGGFSSLFAALSFCIFKLIINKYVYFMQKCVHIIAHSDHFYGTVNDRSMCSPYDMAAFYLILLFFFCQNLLGIFSIFVWFYFYKFQTHTILWHSFFIMKTAANLRGSDKKVIMANFNDNLLTISITSFKMHQIEKLIHRSHECGNNSAPHTHTAICHIDRKIIRYWSGFDVE